MPVATPHDLLFKHVFSHPENAASELRAVLPEALTSRLDWTSLRLVPGSFIDDRLKARHSDLLFSVRMDGSKAVRMDGSKALLYALLEHQSRSDPLMPFRLLDYPVRIWSRSLRRRRRACTLPAVISVVVHHDKRPWSAPTHFEALFDLDPTTREAIAPYVPRFRFVLDDLATVDDRALTARSLPAFAELGLRLLQRARHSPDLLAEMTAWRRTFEKLLRAPHGLAALTALFEYTLQVSEVPLKDLKHFVHTLGSTAEEALMTGAEQLRREGKAEGKVEGRAEGKAEGKAELVSKQLALRFGPLSGKTEARIRSASLEDLDRFAERLLSAKTLDEVIG